MRENQDRMREHQIRLKEHEVRVKENKKREASFEEIKKELVKDKLIDPNNKNLSLNIGKNGFYLNGTKQPDAVFEKYKKLFFPNRTDWSGNFNESINISVD